jgi:hypothetical protein
MVDEKLAPPCGLMCVSCPFLGKNCRGCGYVEGKPFWTDEYHIEVCPIYNCSMNRKNLEHCGLCDELPCEIFLELKDPNISEEEFQRSLKERQESLNERREKGTLKWLEELEEGF